MSHINQPMCTAPLISDYQVVRELKSGLAKLSAIESVRFLATETALAVWVGLTEDGEDHRNAVYRFEDKISDLFPEVLFDFHVISLPSGRTLEEFVSSAERIV